MTSTSTFAMLFFTLFALFSFVASAPTLQQRDVFSPPVLYPGNGTVWRVGECYNVTWDVSHAPQHITNNVGMVILVKNHRLLDLDKPLAQGFNILNAHHEIVVPDVVPGNDYQILGTCSLSPVRNICLQSVNAVFGDSGWSLEAYAPTPLTDTFSDSGNTGEMFTITK
ncbi:hypothetical protein B0H10DRAFT_948754 [Mycena sp. CBHHK59/15]|nr:hypothetical protein B0H10DRAFT_948754 [Mycena sp. CBHHK59/15]